MKFTNNTKLRDEKQEIAPGRIKTVKVLDEVVTGRNAVIRSKILLEHSISDQLRVMRKAIISGDHSMLLQQDEAIDKILKGE